MFEIEEQSKQILEYEEDIKLAKTSIRKSDGEFKSLINKKNTIDTRTNHIKEEIKKKVIF